jgi:probable addiction module antidote protein
MNAVQTQSRPLDAAQYLRNEREILAYIEVAQEQAPGDAAFMTRTLADLARARSLSDLSRKTGLARNTLHQIMCGQSTPTLDTVIKLARALGFGLALQPLPRADDAAHNGSIAQ